MVVFAGVKIGGEEKTRAALVCMLAAWFCLLSQVASCLLVSLVSTATFEKTIGLPFIRAGHFVQMYLVL